MQRDELLELDHGMKLNEHAHIVQLTPAHVLRLGRKLRPWHVKPADQPCTRQHERALEPGREIEVEHERTPLLIHLLVMYDVV